MVRNSHFFPLILHFRFPPWKLHKSICFQGFYVFFVGFWGLDGVDDIELL